MKKTIVYFLLPFLLVFSSCSIMSKYHSYESAAKYKVLDTNGETYNSDVKDVDIDWVSGKVTIEPSDRYEGVTVVEKIDNNKEEFLCHVYRNKNVLSLKYCASGISIPNNINKSLMIYVPINYPLNSLKINNVASSVDIKNINVKDIDITTVSGNVSVFNCYNDKIKVESVSSSVSCALSIETKEIDIEQVSGSLIISLSDNHPGFSLEFETISGKFNSAFETIIEDNKYRYKNCDSLNIDVNTVSGDVSILKIK